jgi:hypothetical protein
VTAWRRFFNTLKGILLELADHNAYHRHLQAHGALDTADEWRRFSDEHWGAKARRGRCC